MLPMLAPSSAPATLRPSPPGISQSQTAANIQRTLSLPQSPQLHQLPDGTLRLRGGPVHPRRVTWSEEVIDNEELGRKKSKVCCIYRRAREFGESSDESSDDSSSSSNTSDEEGKAKPGDSREDSNKNHNHSGHADQGRNKRRRPPSPNAYEKIPRNSCKKDR